MLESPIRTLVAALLIWTATAAAQSTGSPRTDPDGLVRFVLPAGWHVEGIGNGTHFTRSGWPDVKSILKVDAENRPGAMTLEQLASGRAQVHAAQDHVEQSQRRYRLGEFEVWEARYRADIRGDDAIIHDAILLGSGTLVDISLTTYRDAYPGEAGELDDLIRSVQEMVER